MVDLPGKEAILFTQLLFKGWKGCHVTSKPEFGFQTANSNYVRPFGYSTTPKGVPRQNDTNEANPCVPSPSFTRVPNPLTVAAWLLNSWDAN